MLDRAKTNRPDWRDADLHGLRIQHAALLADIAAHKRGKYESGTADIVDHRLWAAVGNAPVSEQADESGSNPDPERGAGSIPAGGTHSDYEEVRRLRRAILDHLRNPQFKRTHDEWLYEETGAYLWD